MMRLNPILVIEIFDYWGIDFMGPFPPSFGFFFFFIKCKNCIDQKEAGDQQYKEKGIKSLDQIRSKTSLLNRRQREQTPLYKP
jgi:hypothetical protein